MSEGIIGKMFGAYKVTNYLGKGGMATVYQGYHAALDRSVAIKVIAADMLEDENFLTRFANEARTLAKLAHPHILPIFDFGESDGLPYIVMPLMKDSLKDRLKPYEPMPLDEALPILTAIAQALDFAHRQGILHRDVKPNNILFDAHDNPCLADFGIARAMQASRGLTGTGILGTLEYMSPEQARGDALDGRSDVYSLGILAHQLLTGQLVFSSTTPAGMIFKHISEPPRPPREFNPALPATVDQVLLKVLTKDPNLRYQTAQEFTRALSDAHAGVVAFTPTEKVQPAITREAPLPPVRPPEPVRAAPPPVMTPPLSQKPASNNLTPWLIGCGIVGLLACLGLAGTFVVAPLMFGSTPTATATPRPPTERPTPTRRPSNTPVPTTERGDTATPRPNSSTDLSLGIFETFADNANGWAIEPQDTDASTERFAIENDRLTWDITANRDLVSLNSPDVDENYFTDGEVMADFELAAGPDDATYGLLFRYVDGDNYYLFNVTPGTGRYSLFARVADEWQTIVDWTDETAVRATGINRLRAEVENDTIVLEINGQRVNVLTDSAILEAGYAGVAVTLYNAGDEASFELSRYEAVPLWPSVLSDEFEDNTNPQGWVTERFDDEFAVVQASITDGRFRIEAEARQSLIHFNSPSMDAVADSSVVADIQRTSGPENSDYGLIFHRDDDGYYYFGVSDVGSYTLLRYADNEWTTLIEWTETDTIRSGEVNRLEARIKENVIALRINGEWVETLEDADSPLSQGDAGVAFQLYDAGEQAVFEYDNFEVREP